MTFPLPSIARPGVKRRDFIGTMGAFLATQLLVPSVLRGITLDQHLKPLRLGFLTDCHAMAEHDAPSWLDRTAQVMNSLKPDLIIGGGDFVHGGFTSTGKTMDHRWEIASSFLHKLRSRLEPLIGNHDLYEPLTADGKLSGNDPRRRWKQHFNQPLTYRSFQFHGYRFLMLDSIKVVGGENPYRGWISRTQLEWLDQELNRVPLNQPIILCSHIPFKTSLRDSLGAMIKNVPGRVRVLNADSVLKKLSKRPLIAILQGHIHLNERVEFAGIPCITGGAVCGKWWEGPNMGTYPGIGLVEIIPSGRASSNKSNDVGWTYLNTPIPVQSRANFLS